MFCGKCGSKVPEGSGFCANCGNPVNNGAPQQQTQQVNYNGYQQQPQQPNYNGYQQQPQQPNYNGYQQPNYGYQPYQAQQEMPMKWFKFLIYFSLFFGAAINVITAIMTMTGSHYGGQADMVYAFFDGLKGMDIFYGLLLLASAAIMVYARFRLSGFFKNGPQMITIVYALNAIVPLIYIIGVSALTDVDLDMSSNVTSIITSIIMIFVNRVYFTKRSHLFIN